jgi:phage terminase small subunit
MPGAAKPTNLLLLEGKGHRTKAEIAHRKAAEKAMQTQPMFSESPQVRADKIAHLEFLRLRRLYAKMKFELVDALDQQVINRYCLEVSSTYQLQEMVARLTADLDAVEEFSDRLKVYDLIHKANVALSKNKEMLIKLEDRLFLNPVARIRAVPKTPPKEEKPTGMAAFLANRA